MASTPSPAGKQTAGLGNPPGSLSHDERPAGAGLSPGAGCRTSSHHMEAGPQGLYAAGERGLRGDPPAPPALLRVPRPSEG